MPSLAAPGDPGEDPLIVRPRVAVCSENNHSKCRRTLLRLLLRSACGAGQAGPGPESLLAVLVEQLGDENQAEMGELCPQVPANGVRRGLEVLDQRVHRGFASVPYLR